MEQTCGSCRFSAPLNTGIPAENGAFIKCRRFPIYERHRPYDWCGEFRARHLEAESKALHEHADEQERRGASPIPEEQS